MIVIDGIELHKYLSPIWVYDCLLRVCLFGYVCCLAWMAVG